MTHPLRSYRKSAGITLSALGARVGVSKGFLCKIEQRKQLPSLALAAKLSEATNGTVPLADFLPAPAPSPCPKEAAE
ncbi:helix-turn-helix domain-containing protein [Methylosinus sp. 3S-1]